MKLETVKIQMLTYLNNIGNNGLLVINIIDFTILPSTLYFSMYTPISLLIDVECSCNINS